MTRAQLAQFCIYVGTSLLLLAGSILVAEVLYRVTR